jgi:hypothetical protein
LNRKIRLLQVINQLSYPFIWMSVNFKFHILSTEADATNIPAAGVAEMSRNQDMGHDGHSEVQIVEDETASVAASSSAQKQSNKTNKDKEIGTIIYIVSLNLLLNHILLFRSVEKGNR